MNAKLELNFQLNVPYSDKSPSTLFAAFHNALVLLLSLLAFFFRKKKKTDKFFCDWIAQAETFLPLIVICSSRFLEKQVLRKKAVWQQQFIVFPFSSAFLIKKLCWEGKWAFFWTFSLSGAKNYWEWKWGSNFSVFPPSLKKKNTLAR